VKNATDADAPYADVQVKASDSIDCDKTYNQQPNNRCE
jgi:hypothetical protein